jgi:hypothetical protein
MAEQSKFAGALGRLNKRPAEPAAAAEVHPRFVAVAESLPSSQTAEGSRRGGKRSNPEFSPTTFFVRRETKRQAARLLADSNAGKDLSDLVEELLTSWITERSHV